MSYRDILAPDQTDAYDAAGDALMASYAEAWAELWEYARARGMREAAERCVFPGRDVERIQQRLQEIQDAARTKAA